MIRPLALDVEDVVKLLAELSTDNPVRIVGPGIPKNAGIAGVAYDVETRRFTINLVSHCWPDDGQHGDPVNLTYAVRIGRSGTAGDWGMPTPLGHVDA